MGTLTKKIETLLESPDTPNGFMTDIEAETNRIVEMITGYGVSDAYPNLGAIDARLVDQISSAEPNPLNIHLKNDALGPDYIAETRIAKWATLVHGALSFNKFRDHLDWVVRSQVRIRELKGEPNAYDNTIADLTDSVNHVLYGANEILPAIENDQTETMKYMFKNDKNYQYLRDVTSAIRKINDRQVDRSETHEKLAEGIPEKMLLRLIHVYNIALGNLEKPSDPLWVYENRLAKQKQMGGNHLAGEDQLRDWEKTAMGIAGRAYTLFPNGNDTDRPLYAWMAAADQIHE